MPQRLTLADWWLVGCSYVLTWQRRLRCRLWGCYVAVSNPWFTAQVLNQLSAESRDVLTAMLARGPRCGRCGRVLPQAEPEDVRVSRLTATGATNASPDNTRAARGRSWP